MIKAFGARSPRIASFLGGPIRRLGGQWEGAPRFMKILLMTQYYPPEIGAAPNRLSHLARSLADSGHMVTVLTALPNYPAGKIFEEYKGRLLMEEQRDGLRIIRTWLVATKSKAFFLRILNYCSFSVLSFLAAAWKVGLQDVVIVESPPLFLGLSGFLISRLKRARFVLNVSDLWPESAVALGIVRNARLIRIATLVEEFLYRKASLISAQTEGIVASIRSRARDSLIALIPNGADVFAASPQNAELQKSVRNELGFNEHFVVGYTGLLGLAQGLETVLDSAQLLSKFPKIVIAFIGDGPDGPRLKSIAQQSGLQNVRFVPAQPASKMPEVLSTLDIALVPLKRHPLFKGALPSKMFAAMGAGIPIVGSVEGEARAVIAESRGGICVEPENSLQIAEAILELYRDPELRKSLGENGRSYVAKHFNRRDAARKFEEFLLTSCSPHTARPDLASTGT
jgi:glycosyltransferase involved in cell wall biosynthesis